MKNKFLILGIIIISFMSLLALLSPYLSPYSLNYQDLPHRFDLPNKSHLLGQNQYGGDILTHLLFGAKISLSIAITTTLICCVFGMIFGTIAALGSSKIDSILMRVVDIFLAFPGILLAIGISSILEPAAHNVIFALCATGWTSYARLVRGQVLSLKEQDFVQSAKALGASSKRVVLCHIWPNLMGALIVQASFGMAGVIIAESALSFLGIGVGADSSSWGLMIDEARRYMTHASRLHLLLPPLLAIMVTVLGFNFLGDGLLQKLDPRLEGMRYGN
ncbi:MAG: ABC transporter permease [Deltaproteobacteria bacterium]|nr:ABC transporter permease [Deltaproteobacteria bacterium]